ncbi:hypothetical protein BDN72DRAFT_831924 [Pluteus cervinus]|uniref:Uncharacterized protein n=1 Tax=Pluteus cervinus TaxID=181527 RepID=A0ACD3BC54_9AGAR|nr:hypothetical protein BDN72DRAFT_831924 [Pluteus cervinus]
MSSPFLTEATMSTALEQYATYDFEQDAAYQQGLASIVSTGALHDPSSEGYEQVLRQTRVFYFNKVTGSSITPDQAREAELTRQQQLLSVASGSQSESILPSNTVMVTPNPGSSQPPPTTAEDRVLTFAELQELIQAGKLDQIPNNKNIPNVLSKDIPSESTLAPRKKPWEVATQSTNEE